MVALATPRFGFRPNLNLARPMLREALECVDRGDLVGAGVRLREAVRRQLVAMCEWYDCMPSNARRRSLGSLVHALREAKQLPELGVQWLTEMIEVGNSAAHLGHIKRGPLRGAILGLFLIIDCDPCGEAQERVEHPQPENKWDNDDDNGDDWKIGGAV